MTQRGSAIWSYTLRSAGAILLHSVPATIITSDWRGEARGAKPKRSRSQRGIDTCIISTAQQARPKVIHINEPVRAQVMRSSVAATKKPLSDSSWLTSRKYGSLAPTGLPVEGSIMPAAAGATTGEDPCGTALGLNPIRARLSSIRKQNQP